MRRTPLVWATLWATAIGALTAIPAARAQDALIPPPLDLNPAASEAPATTIPAAILELAPEPTTTAPTPATEPAPEQAATLGPVATAPAATGPAGAAVASVSNPALAERLASMATALLRGDKIGMGNWQYAEALLQAAVRVAPDEPRYAAFLVETANQVGDTETAQAALAAYRKLRPMDEFAQVQQIDAYLVDMSMEQKLDYLGRLLGERSVPFAVRSVVAYRLAMLRAERTEDAVAGQLIDEALKLNPLNLDALRVKYNAQTPANAGDRVRMLLQMLRSNPAQPQLGIAVAREMSAAGLAARSMDWFNAALDLYQRMGIQPPPDVGVDYAAEFLISGDPRGAALVCERLLEQSPNELPARMMQLVALKAADDKEGLDKALKQAQVAVANQLAVLRSAAGDATATTKPVDTPDAVALPDPAAVLNRLMAARNPELIARFVPAAASVAWMKIYFEGTPLAAGQAMAWVKALEPFASPQDVLLKRLRGWAMLVAGNKDEARTLLKSIAEADPLAALGLVRLAEGDLAAQQQADALARRTLSDYPSGTSGATLAEALSKRGIKVTPNAAAPDIEKVLLDFPKDWARIIDQPQRFYLLRLDPVRAGVTVGEPVLVKVTAINVSNFDLTVGPNGVIHPDLWFDAQLRGVHQQVFPAEAYQRFAGPMVLKPGESVSQVVRLDQRGLLAALESNPVAAFQLTAMVMTNPTTIGGQVTVGPCGTRATMSKLMERTALPIGMQAAQQRIALAVQVGTPSEKVRAIETLAKFVRIWVSQPGGAQQYQRLIGWGVDLITLGRNDSDLTVQAWSTYLYAVMTGDKKTWNDMLSSEDWLTRALSVVASDYMDVPRDPIKRLANEDADKTVRALAAASLAANLPKPTTEPTSQPAEIELPPLPPATGPTTAPATGPAIAPATAPTPAAPTPAPEPAPAPTPAPTLAPALAPAPPAREPEPAPTPAPAPEPAPALTPAPPPAAEPAPAQPPAATSPALIPIPPPPPPEAPVVIPPPPSN